MALGLANKLKSLSDKVAQNKLVQSATEMGDKLAHSAGELSEKVVHSAGEMNEKVVAYISENGEKLKQFYSDSKLLEKIQGALKSAGAMVLYPVMILFNLMRSPSTSVQDKMMIVAPLAYFILPTDLIPDYLVGAGYIDDGAAIMTCLQKLSTLITSEVIKQTNEQYQQMIGKVDDEVIDKITKQIKGGQDTSSDN